MTYTNKFLYGLAFSVLFLFILACNTNTPNKASDEQQLGNNCCKECLDAFSQSPVGVGAAGVNCGAFSTGKPMSKKCQDYFKANPKTVAECQ